VIDGDRKNWRVSGAPDSAPGGRSELLGPEHGRDQIDEKSEGDEGGDGGFHGGKFG
jgi:hypothetical protein